MRLLQDLERENFQLGELIIGRVQEAGMSILVQ
jgi:hypothetical protein